MKLYPTPPKWADRFLQWYCSAESIEEIQGDTHELFYREVDQKGLTTAKRRFVWNVIKYFRWSNIKRENSINSFNNFIMWKNYLKTGLRNIAKNKSHSIINLISLSIGLSAFILISLYVRFETTYDKYHDNADNIYRLVSLNYNGEGEGIAKISGPVGPAAEKEISNIKYSIRFCPVNTRLLEFENVKSFESEGLYVDPTVFKVFSFTGIEGDLNSSLNSPNSIVITQKLARKYFNNESALGKIINFNNELEFTVTAVIEDVPLNSHFQFSYLLPIEMDNRGWKENWQRSQYYTYLLLEPGVKPESVVSKIPAVIKPNIPEDNFEDLRLGLQNITTIHLQSNLFRELGTNSSAKTIYFYSIVAILILLIACVNFTNILTARATERVKEVSVRKTMGARRQQLIIQFILESAILVGLATILAMGISAWMLPNLNSITGTNLSVATLFSPNFIGIVSLIGLATILLSSSYPAFFLSAFDPIFLSGNLKTKSKGFLRNSLVVFQLGISTFLIIAIIVINIQQNFIQKRDLGFKKEQIINIPIRDQKNRENYHLLKTKLEKNKDIISTTVTGNMLGGGDYGFPVKPEGVNENEIPAIRVLVVDEGFINTFEMELVAGRDFSPTEWGDENVEVILNQEAVKQLGWKEAVGKEMGIRLDGIKSSPVVGVLKDFHFRSLHEQIQPILLFTRPTWFSMISLKFNPINQAEVLGFLENEWKTIEPDFPLTYGFFDQSMERLYAAENRTQKITTYASVLAIFIAIVGLISLTSFNIQRRTKEFSVRKVLGASVSEITLLQLKQYLILAGISISIGIPLSVIFSNFWMRNFSYRANIGTEIFIYGAILTSLLVLITVGILCLKASRANPVDNLRME